MLSRRSLGKPAADIPLAEPVGSRTEPLSVTWYGHSTVLVEVDGYGYSPIRSGATAARLPAPVGPQRLHPNAASGGIAAFLDAVLISHDHYDHLDMDTRSAARPKSAVSLRRAAGSWCAPEGLGHPVASCRRARFGTSRPGSVI